MPSKATKRLEEGKQEVNVSLANASRIYLKALLNTNDKCGKGLGFLLDKVFFLTLPLTIHLWTTTNWAVDTWL